MAAVFIPVAFTVQVEASVVVVFPAVAASTVPADTIITEAAAETDMVVRSFSWVRYLCSLCFTAATALFLA